MYVRIAVVVIVVLVICVLVFWYTFGTSTKNDQTVQPPRGNITVKNPYVPNQDIAWVENDFTVANWPNTFDFDFDIKKHIVDMAITFPQKSCIIDCGAHIGDGSIAIAMALKHHNREDVVVYAIEPSKEKCSFIQKVVDKNHITNLKIIQHGLSDKIGIYIPKPLPQDSLNTGGTNWELDPSPMQNNPNGIDFTMLDHLVETGQITHTIQYIHLDVEGMEINALRGATHVLQTHVPTYLSIEEWTNDTTIPNFLKTMGYQYTTRLGSNNIYTRM